MSQVSKGSERNFTTVEIPKKIHMLVKLHACKENCSVKEVVEQAVVQYCSSQQYAEDPSKNNDR